MIAQYCTGGLIIFLISFYAIKLLIIGKLLLQQLYFLIIGIGTYDHILEIRQISEIKENLSLDYISKDEYAQKYIEIIK